MEKVIEWLGSDDMWFLVSKGLILGASITMVLLFQYIIRNMFEDKSNKK